MSDKTQMSIEEVAVHLNAKTPEQAADEFELSAVDAAANRGLITKLVEVMAAISHIEKQGQNDTQHYKYLRVADVSRIVRKLLVARNVMLVPCKASAEYSTLRYTKNDYEKVMNCVGIQMDYQFIDGDTGETLIVAGLGASFDSGDKAIFKAMTGLRKYIMVNTFHILDEADPEADESVDQELGNGSPEAQKAVADRVIADFKAKNPDAVVGTVTPVASNSPVTPAKANPANLPTALGVGFVSKVEASLTAKKQAYLRVTQNDVNLTLFDNVILETVDGPLPLFHLLTARTDKNPHGMLPNTFCHFIVETSKQYKNIKGVRQIGGYFWDESGVPVRQV